MSDSDVESYLHEISQFRLLTKEKEQKLAREIADGNMDSREEMINANLRLVVAIAKKYANRGLPLLDLIAEGNIGLLKAVERFRAEEDKRFSTYASWWIKQAIRRALSAKVKNVRVPAYMVEMVSRWRRAANELSQELEREPTMEEIAAQLDLSDNKIEAIQKAIEASSSSAYGGGGNSDDEDGEVYGNIEEMLARAGKDYSPQATFTDNEEEKLELLLHCLGNRERKILRHRYGIGTSQILTLESIGQKLNKALTRERVRQIETQALRELHRILEEAIR